MANTFDAIIFGLVATELARAARAKDDKKKAQHIKRSVAMLQTLLNGDESELSALAASEDL